MRIILYLIGLIMISAWLIGFLRFNAGGFIYLVLIISAIAILLRVNNKVEQRKHRKIMRKRILFLAITGFVAGTLFTACERNASERMDDQQDKINREQRDVTDEQKDLDKARLEMDQFKAETEMQIKENDEQIIEYKAKMDKEPERREKYRDKIDDLEKKNREMERKIREYKYTTNEDWNNFRSEFKRDMNDLGTSIKNVFRDEDKDNEKKE